MPGIIALLVMSGLELEKVNMQPLVPIHAHWDVTAGCNFRCKFCLASASVSQPDELTTAEAFSLIDKLHDSGIVFLKILGGEPFFRKDILRILRYAANKGMIISFSTNASLITVEVAETLYELRNSLAYVQMSLYGDSEESYQETTGSPCSFKRALEGLRLVREKNLDVSILMVVTEDNFHRISNYFEIARKNNVKEFRVTPKIAVGRAAKEIDCGAYSGAKIWASLIGELKKIRFSLKELDPYVRIDARPLLGDYVFKETGIPYFWQNCDAASTMIYISPNGEAAPCPFLKEMPLHLKKIYTNIELENIKEKSFADVWNSPLFNRFREYYDPRKNKFTINVGCKYYKKGSCIPCILTPCNCLNMIKGIVSELRSRE